ncbi:MAG: ABC transporter ATP-binding protein [Planctomycetota bacterium]|nr:ABC transporter ATP-binding protein [Planctomycetota bacterium]
MSDPVLDVVPEETSDQVTSLIEARELGRWYGEVVGLSDLSVVIQPGITGLVGPNGSGKSTFMKLIVGELKPSRGGVRVLGHQPFANRELYRDLGFCPQQDALYDHLSAHGFLAHLLRITGMSANESKQRAKRALGRVGLTEAMHRKCGTYSKGMRQRVRIAQAIAHDPKLVIFDEPLSGLDPIARHQIRTIFKEMVEAGSSLLVSSHVLHELQGLTDRIVLIHRGRLLAQGSVTDIRRLLSQHPRRISITSDAPVELAVELMRLPGVRATRIAENERTLTVETRDAQGLFDQLPAIATRLKAGITSLDSDDEDLEAVFDYLVD